MAVALTFNNNGSCESAGVGITGVASKAYRATGVESALNGRTLDDQAILSAASHACDGIDINSDLYASVEYRRHLAEIYTKRALADALAHAI